MVKAVLGYDIVPGMTVEEYEKWLREVHIPDLSRIPWLRRLVLNTVRKPLIGQSTFYRVAELHYDSMEDFEKAQKWRAEHPVSIERSPQGKTAFRFYVLAETEVIEFGEPRV